jgi:hypothetical protein
MAGWPDYCDAVYPRARGAVELADPAIAPLSADEVAAFRRDGFVLPRFQLAPAQIARLIALADRLGGAPSVGSSSRRDDPLLVCAAELRLSGLIAPLIGPDSVLDACVVRHAVESGGEAVPWHQDGADGSIGARASLAIRVALDGVDRANGCMRLLPRAHERLVREIRNARDRRRVELAPERIDEALAVHAVRAPGELTLYDPDTFYCEPTNRSDRRRAALMLRFLPARAIGSNDTATSPGTRV